jgi:hypothetical protein
MPELPPLRTRSYFRLSTFEDEILVQCPKCRRCANAQAPSYDRSKRKYVVHISCLYCAAQHDVETDFDYWNHLNLWLKVSCCGDVLWALNARHLGALEAFVSAGLRDTRAGPSRNGPVYGTLPLPAAETKGQKAHVAGEEATRSWQRRNSHMYSRLPAWLTSAKNRPDVLRGLRKLRTRLAGTAQI